ncbi:MAG TPA: alkaline phosphatase D family protein [Polyangiaceae bacterium]|nr:alkaline phosphatase D family protein [Polyangiaceae bacterium]
MRLSRRRLRARRPARLSRPRLRARRPARLAPLVAAALAACDGPPPPAPSPSQAVAVLDSLEGHALTRIALGSCAEATEPQRVWDAILRDAPDLYLALGDNVYGDTEDMSLLRARYWRQEAVPGFAALRRRVPIYGTWDDHDYGVNDGGREYPKKAESQQLFLDFLRVPPGSPRRAREGVYDAVLLGPPGRRVHLIALDLRYHRSPISRPGSGRPYRRDASPEATMLGDAQWAWFERELARPAEVRVVLSSTALVPPYNGGESWDNMPLERERFLRAIAAAAPSANLVVSGDRHFGEISALDPGPAGPPLYELAASGLSPSKAGAQNDANDLRVGPPVANQINYGLVDFEWAAPEPALVLRLRDEAGRDLVTRRVPMAPAPTAP